MSYPQNIAMSFVTQTKGIKYWNGKYYIYNGGCYEPLSDDDFDSLLIAFLQTKYNNMAHTSALLTNITRNIKGRIKICDGQENNSWLSGSNKEAIAFKNGLLVTTQAGAAVLEKHDPDFFTLSKLPYDYDPDAKCPRWLKFLDEVMEEDAERIKLLQQWSKYILGNNIKEHVFLLLVGNSGTGKSTFISLIHHLVGIENVANVPLARFGDRFSLSSLVGKKLNTFAETSKEISRQEEEKLKAYSTGDRQMFERKNKDVFFSFPTAKLVFATNELPQFHDKTDALWDRMRYVPFNVKFRDTSKQDKDLKDKLFNELSGIFNWANSADISNGIINPKPCKDAVSQYKRDSNPVRAFLEENYVAGDGYVETRQLFSLYERYCKAMSCSSVNKFDFGKALFYVFPDVKVGKTPMKNGERHPAYYGLVEKDYDSNGINENKDKKKMVRLLVPEVEDYYIDGVGREWYKSETQQPQERNKGWD